MDRTWMYQARRTDDYFRQELNKFVKAAENNAKDEKKKVVVCPCKNCKNIRVIKDPTTIRPLVLMYGFVEDYMIWTSHGEKNNAPPSLNQIDEIMQNDDFGRMFDAYDDFGEGGSNDDGGHGSDGVNEEGDGHANDGYDSSEDDELDDSDFLTQLLRNTKEKIFVSSAKGLANFETVKKSAKENVYERSKGCPKHWTVLRIVLELLILKAKHGWSDGSFNDLLRER
ncbi:hypothetical protein ACQ4PT_027104 [Festuca glaucescens]